MLVVGGRIDAVGSGAAPSAATTFDVGPMIVAPGFVDLHVHGAGGRQVAGATAAEVASSVRELARRHAQHGTTALLPTTVSDSPAALAVAVEGVAMAMAAPGMDGASGLAATSGATASSGVTVIPGATAIPGATGGGGGSDARFPGSVPTVATVLGTHLEGPWLAPGRAGAHAPDQLRLPDPAELETLIAASGGTIRVVTFAPELAGSAELVATGRAAGITMSVGHTDADYETVRAAFAAGARHVTHVGNAMAALDRRRPGPIAAAVVDSGATLEVIADGIHVHPGFLAFLAASAPDRLVAVTDATSATGMPPGHYRLGTLDVVVDGHRVVLAEDPDTLAGSVLTMDRAVATLVDAGVDVVAAIGAATGTPAGVVGAATKGHLRAGADADLVVLDNTFTAVATVIGGRVVWDRDRLFSASGDLPR